jgi:DNA-binding MarR family transcriptional regulator
VHILKVLVEDGPSHVKGIGQRLLIKGPQMTHLIDGLAEREMVQRQTDPGDRRSINVTITSTGRHFLETQERNTMEGMRALLSALSVRELQELSSSLRNLRDTLLKLQ